MTHASRLRLALTAAITLIGLGTLSGVTLGQVATPAAGTPAAGIEGAVLGQAATPVVGTPVPVPEAPGQVNVNVFVEVNTSVGLGTVSTGERGIHIQRIGSCETGANNP